MKRGKFSEAKLQNKNFQAWRAEKLLDMTRGRSGIALIASLAPKSPEVGDLTYDAGPG